MGDSLGRPDVDPCSHPYSSVAEETVTAFAGGKELSNNATVILCHDCDTIIDVKSNHLTELKYMTVFDNE